MSMFTFATTLLSHLKPAALSLAAQQGAEKVIEAGYTASNETVILSPLVRYAVEVGVVVLVIAIILCLYRIMRGPHLADRVLAADALSLQVVGLVILLTLRLGTTAFFDVALVVAIIGFATTLAFAQLIGAHALAKRESANES